MAEHALESRLRPAVELYSVTVCAAAALLCLQAPWAVALSPQLGRWSAAGFALFGLLRLRQAGQVLRYRRHIRRLPRYALTSRQIPLARQRLFMGRGFRWTQLHTQRLVDAQDPAVARYLRQPWPYRLARALEQRLEHSPPPLSWLVHLTARDSPFNPLRPLSPVGGSPLLHGVEPNEANVTLPLTERVGHTLVLGTTRVGKTRLAELYITQDIHRGEVCIVFDPKGDADLLKRIYVEARRAGRERELYVFHLGWPDISCRYNAIGRFSRVTEVASRIAGQLSAEGNSAAFREFAWRFVNIIARALVDLGRRPDYLQIQRHVINIDALFIEYAEHFFARHGSEAWPQILALESRINERNIPRHMQSRERRVVAIEQYLATKRVFDPVLDGLRSAVRYDRTYFDKIVASAGSDLLWIEPLDTSPTPNTATKAPAIPAGGFTLPNPIERGQQQLRAVSKGERAQRDASAPTEPVYTIPENATLLGSVAMTALIGRVPVDGTVNDPYPFKVLVGADNLAANGIELPEVAGAVMSGTAIGDWTLSCVRGQIESITFVFEDGTIRSVPPPQAVTSRNQSTASGNSQRLRGGLGYLSDPHGIPCIAGERRHRRRSQGRSAADPRTADSSASPDPLCQWNNTAVRLIARYGTDITAGTSSGNNRTIHFRFSGCIGSSHCASSRH